ncbi:MAG: cyanophycin synthetase [Chlamydiota bacterium]
MKCKKLIRGFPIALKGAKEVEITGISADARHVLPGNLFVLNKDHSFGGIGSMAHAMQNGAAAILTDIYDPFLAVPQLVTPSLEKVVPSLVDRYYGSPSKRVRVLGILGSQATVAAHLLRHCLEELGEAVGLLSSVEKWRQGSYVPADLFADDLISNQKSLGEMLDQGKKVAVLEMLPRALQGGAFAEVDLHATIFAQFSSQEEGCLPPEEMLQEVAPLLLNNHCSFVALNENSPYIPFCRETLRILPKTYGFSRRAELQMADISFSQKGTKGRLVHRGKSSLFSSPLLGRPPLYGMLAALSALVSCGYCIEEITPYLASFRGVPGRMQKVGRTIFVDAARTPSALEESLLALRACTNKPIVLVFGSLGGTARNSRFHMGKIADRYADFTILTNNNPGAEDPASIVADLQAGFSSNRRQIVLHRREAIYEGVRRAHGKALLLIAGKGHEKTESCAHTTLPFDDVEVAKEALRVVSQKQGRATL